MKIRPPGSPLSLNAGNGNDNDPASLRYNVAGTVDTRVFEIAEAPPSDRAPILPASAGETLKSKPKIDAALHRTTEGCRLVELNQRGVYLAVVRWAWSPNLNAYPRRWPVT